MDFVLSSYPSFIYFMVPLVFLLFSFFKIKGKLSYTFEIIVDEGARTGCGRLLEDMAGASADSTQAVQNTVSRTVAAAAGGGDGGWRPY